LVKSPKNPRCGKVLGREIKPTVLKTEKEKTVFAGIITTVIILMFTVKPQEDK